MVDVFLGWICSSIERLGRNPCFSVNLRGQLFGTILSHNHGYPTSSTVAVWQIIWICKVLPPAPRITTVHLLFFSRWSSFWYLLAPGATVIFPLFSIVTQNIDLRSPSRNQPPSISLSSTSILIQPANVDQSFFWLHQMPGWELMPFMVFHCKQLYTDYANRLRQFIWGDPLIVAQIVSICLDHPRSILWHTNRS